MLGEIVNIFVGQCGIQMAHAIWELLCVEHAVGPDGLSVMLNNRKPYGDAVASTVNDQAADDPSCNTFFEETKLGRYNPRTILLDTEPSVIDEIRCGVYRNLFNRRTLMNGIEDGASNYARGFYQLITQHSEPFADGLRVVAEACDLLNGLCFFHSYGGGTGSGLLMGLEDRIENSYPKQTKFDYAIYPSRQQATSVVEPYNTVLAASSPCRLDAISLLFDNHSLINVLRERVAIEGISFSHMNRLLAQVFSGMTANLRFNAWLSAKLTDLETNLIPYPTMQYLQCSFAPLFSEATFNRTQITYESLLGDALHDDNQLSYSQYSLNDSVFMSCALLYRGDVSIRAINASVEDAKRRKAFVFTDWSPCGYKIGGCNQPMTSIPGSGLAECPLSLTALYNSTSVRGCLNAIADQYESMKKRKAFFYWYLYEGMEEAEFQEAFDDFKELMADYDLVEKCHQNPNMVLSSEELHKPRTTSAEKKEDHGGSMPASGIHKSSKTALPTRQSKTVTESAPRQSESAQRVMSMRTPPLSIANKMSMNSTPGSMPNMMSIHSTPGSMAHGLSMRSTPGSITNGPQFSVHQSAMEDTNNQTLNSSSIEVNGRLTVANEEPKESMFQKQSMAQKESMAQKQSMTQKQSLAQKQSMAEKQSMVQKQSIAKKQSMAEKQSMVQKQSMAEKQSMTQKQSMAQKQSMVQRKSIANEFVEPKQSMAQKKSIASRQSIAGRKSQFLDDITPANNTDLKSNNSTPASAAEIQSNASSAKVPSESSVISSSKFGSESWGASDSNTSCVRQRDVSDKNSASLQTYKELLRQLTKY